MPRAPPSIQAPISAQFPSTHFVVGGGVAIFHVASARVVVCRAVSRRHEEYFFLPKGRRDAGEESGPGAEREGYEESGYRNRILPLPTPHRQPEAHPRTTASKMTAEPVWTQLLPLGHHNVQYILYWYIAETLPPALEAELVTDPGAPYKPPPAYPAGLALRDRLAMEPEGYEPVRHEGTGVDEEELGYTSQLVGVEEACRLLGRGTVSADVVMRGWKGIQDRFALEDAVMAESPEGVA